MTDVELQKLLSSIPPKQVGGTIGALLAPLLVQKILGSDSALLQAMSVPMGWSVGYNLMPDTIFPLNSPVNHLN